MYTSSQIQKVLQACNVKVIHDLAEEFMIFCLWHPNYRTPSGEINKETGRFYCFACHASASLIEFVQKSKGQTPFQATRLIESKADGFKRNDPQPEFDKPPEYVPFDTGLIERLHAACMQDRPVEYLRGRGITTESIKNFQIGYSAKQDMIIVPMHSPDGMCVGFVGRSVEGKIFKNSDDLPRSSILFNLHRRRFCGNIVLVESTFDAIRVEQCGHPAIASLGNSMSKRQYEILSKTFHNVTIVPDNDEAGKIMAAKLINDMGDRMHVANLPTGVKDVGDLDDQSLQKFLSTATDPLLAFIERE